MKVRLFLRANEALRPKYTVFDVIRVFEVLPDCVGVGRDVER